MVACGSRIRCDRGLAHLARIVRRDAGRHADRDARSAVCQQVREPGRQHHRLLVLVVVGGAEIHRIVGNAGQQAGGHLGHPRLGVAHGGRVIAVDVAEIALALDQRVADGEILREPDQGVVDRRVAVRVELAHDVADHAGAFLEPRRRIQPQLLHGVDQPAMDRFQPVAHVRQAALHDGGERIGEIALGQRVAEVGVLNAVAPTWWWRCSGWRSGSGALSHAGQIAGGVARGNQQRDTWHARRNRS